jgi:uroporphyrin-III C-methyltransferase
VPQLLTAGFAANLPVAVVHRAGCREQQHLATTLQHLQADVAASGLASPAVIILGEVVAHAMNVVPMADPQVAVA